MNIIKRDNQRAVIHLSKIQGSDLYLARALVFTLTHDGSYSSHLVGIKKLTAIEAAELRSQISAMAQFNITLVDADASQAEIIVATALLGTTKQPAVEILTSEESIPSPYASIEDILEAFLSSQKTRAPTR